MEVGMIEELLSFVTGTVHLLLHRNHGMHHRPRLQDDLLPGRRDPQSRLVPVGIQKKLRASPYLPATWQRRLPIDDGVEERDGGTGFPDAHSLRARKGVAMPKFPLSPWIVLRIFHVRRFDGDPSGRSAESIIRTWDPCRFGAIIPPLKFHHITMVNGDFLKQD